MQSAPTAFRIPESMTPVQIGPYFAELPPDALDRRQLIEAYRVLTAGDFDQMRAVGSYEFYRLEITADGRWLMFIAGE